MAEVALQPLAGLVVQRNECLTVIQSVRTHVAPDLSVAALVGVLVAQTPEQLHGRMTLLGRSVFVVAQNPVDDGVQPAEHWRGFWLAARVRFGLRVGEDSANPARATPAWPAN